MIALNHRCWLAIVGIFGALGQIACAQTPAIGNGGAIRGTSNPSASPASNQLHFGLMNAVEQYAPYLPIDKLEGNVEFAGSVTMLDLGRRWMQNFNQFYPTVQWKGAADGSESALKALAENPSLLVGISRPVDESDLKLLQSGRCKEPVAITVALEAMAICVHQENPLPYISQDTFKSLFASNQGKEAKVWGDLGVTGALAKEPIARYERDRESGTQTFLSRVLLGGAETLPPTKVCASNKEVCDSIAKDIRGVGLSDMNYAIPYMRKVPLFVDGHVVEPTEENVLSGKYPLVRPLILVFDKSMLQSDKQLRESIIRFVLSRDGQLSVMKSGFFPVDPGFANHQIAEIFGLQMR